MDGQTEGVSNSPSSVIDGWQKKAKLRQISVRWQMNMGTESRLTLVRGVWEKREKPSNRYSWSSYSITVGLSVCKKTGRFKLWTSETSEQMDGYLEGNFKALEINKFIPGSLWAATQWFCSGTVFLRCCSLDDTTSQAGKEKHLKSPISEWILLEKVHSQNNCK